MSTVDPQGIQAFLDALADADLSPTRSSFIYRVESLPLRYESARA